jgi:sugar-specific transcriptional regulator TrmB
MQNGLQKTIEGLGFSDKEAAVYIACLELDDSPNTEITRRTGLNRVTNYEILKRLEKRGVVGSYKRRGIKHFAAIHPRTLIQQAHERVSIAEQQLPELLSLVNKHEKKPRIYFFEDVDGIKSIYDDSLASSTEILTFTNPEDVEALLGKKYVDGYLRERVQRKISVRGLAPNTTSGKNARDVGPNFLREVRLFDTKRYTMSNEIMLYDNKVTMFSSKDRVGLIVENDELAETFRNIWRMVWEQTRDWDT